MNKVLEFLKSHKIIVKWTIWYFLILWLILRYIFGFDMFSYNYWWKFFHATLHGFYGFVFGALVYSAIPLYIVTTIITYRNQEYVVKIPMLDKIFAFVSKMFSRTQPEPEPESEQKTEPEPEQHINDKFPDDLPPELRVPFMRAKQHRSFNGAVSVYNKTQPNAIHHAPEPTQNEIPIPSDFDIGDNFDDTTDSIPTFTDINFDVSSDTPIATESELTNNTTQYFDKNKTEYETYRDYVATEKYLIYEHNDPDFWVMDGDTWFASGKTKDSPINELLTIAQQNGLSPIVYLASQNIMDIDSTIANFESMGVRVVKSLDEL